MKPVYLFLVSLLLSLGLIAQRQEIDFNKGWKFTLGDNARFSDPGWDDAGWRKLELPHDWSIEADFSATAPATTSGGALPGGIGWYRKTFILPANATGKNVRIEFDGIYRNSKVWINGHLLGTRPYGYSSFAYELQSFLAPYPQKNHIAVRVDNSAQPNSRWYSGSGIYRNTRLVITQAVAVAHWGQFISTPVVGEGHAIVNVQTSFLRTNSQQGNCWISQQLFDERGKLVAGLSRMSLGAGGWQNEIQQITTQLQVVQPKLWSVDHPHRYRLVTTVYSNGARTDRYVQWFGIRKFRFDAEHGFFLNNRPLKIHGVCNHHDLGGLGAAVNVDALTRQLKLLKEMGCNAIRTAHNPPAPELLDLCDKMGFLVMDEAFDMWAKKKNKYDYAADFKQWHVRDLQDMVLRDRNHPSVFMWSIGNEIREQFDSSGISITRELAGIVRSLDTTRPVTSALTELNPSNNFIFQSNALDVVGMNYNQDQYANIRSKYPAGTIFLGSENVSALATRGTYDWPSDSIKRWPLKGQKFVEDGHADYSVSAYDQVSAYWGSTHEETWKVIKKFDFLAGEFVWTGFDYLGEPTPYPWPARSSYFGIIDLAGFPKDIYYMYQSEWTDKPVLHVFPHWNWKRGDTVDVWAYYNRADEVELWLNGKSLGTKRKQGDELHVMWRVPYEPGVLKATSRKNGVTVLERKIETTGAPAAIRLEADRKRLRAGSRDLLFVKVSVVDAAGRMVQDANIPLRFRVEGPGTIAYSDNGYPADSVSLTKAKRSTWKGLALVVVKAGWKQGNSTLIVESPGLPTARFSFITREQDSK